MLICADFSDVRARKSRGRGKGDNCQIRIRKEFGIPFKSRHFLQTKETPTRNACFHITLVGGQDERVKV